MFTQLVQTRRVKDKPQGVMDGLLVVVEPGFVYMCAKLVTKTWS